MSASIRPTFLPIRASATAMLAETVDLPTPPLPEPIATIVPLRLLGGHRDPGLGHARHARSRRRGPALELGALLGGEAGRVEHDRRDARP